MSIAHPGFDQGWLAYVGLIPLLWFGEFVAKNRQFILWVILSETLKWFVLVVWLRHVSWAAVVVIALSMGLYQSIWYIVFRYLRTKLCGGNDFYSIYSIISLGALWGFFEYLRTSPFAIPGAPLSITQWNYPFIITVCSVVGGFGLSCLIVYSNLLIFRYLLKIKNEGIRIHTILDPVSLVGMTLILGVFVWKNLDDTFRKLESDVVSVDVAVIQPNQPAYRYWDMQRVTSSVENVFRITGNLVSRGESFDLMVWPEGTLPLPVYSGSSMDIEISRLVKHSIKRPLLLGNQGNLGGKSYNAVFMYDKEGRLRSDYYAKNVLVPFGEYVPLRKWLGPLQTIVPIEEDFTRGEKTNNFKIVVDGKQVNISALICYEDCFPHLGVRSSLDEADLIFVATYDVWYGEEFGAYMHAAHSVVRAAEIRRPVLRCGSAGWSGYIDEFGAIREVVRNENDSIYFAGSSIIEIEIPINAGQSFFTRHYSLICSIMAALGVSPLLLIGYKKLF